jgi:hypothetical protein
MSAMRIASLMFCCLLFGGTSYAATTVIGHKAQSATSEKSNKAVHKVKRIKINAVTDEDDAWVGNVETNIYRAGTFENVQVGYSASNDWDFALSMLNTQVIGPNKYFQGDTFFSIAKTLALAKDVSFVIGSQNGLTLFNTQPRQWYNYNYLDLRYDVVPELMIHAGPYFANKALTNTVRKIGYLTGAEITFIPNQLALQMDYISGHHSLSGATVNMLVNITTHSQVYFGVYVPEKDSGNEFSGIVGFNLSTKRL